MTRIVVHDYCGHPFPVHLSRELARRGNEVLHLYCPSVTSARGALTREPTDPEGFRIDTVELPRPFQKYAPIRRVLQELQYGRLLADRALRFHPDVVLSANTPLLAQRRLWRDGRADDVRVVFWLQDILGIGIRSALRKRNAAIGTIVGGRFVGLERGLLRHSDAIVAISEDFRQTLLAYGMASSSIHVIENWAPLDELRPGPRDNPWAREHNLAHREVFLYSGTLGMKHDPTLLVELAKTLRSRPQATVVVVSEGPGADWLHAQKALFDLDNLQLFGYQPYDRLSDVLATGDILITILEHDAGVFSVPSKVLSYLCAGRPIIAAVPKENLSARVIENAGSGIVVDPADAGAFVHGALCLLDDPEREEYGRRALQFARDTFDITSIADRFEAALVPVGTEPGSRVPANPRPSLQR